MEAVVDINSIPAEFQLPDSKFSFICSFSPEDQPKRYTSSDPATLFGKKNKSSHFFKVMAID